MTIDLPVAVPAHAADTPPGAAAEAWRNWSLSRDGDGIAWLTLDKADASTNTLASAVLDELNVVLDALDRNPPKGLVIRSGKANGFVAGADVDEFGQGTDIEASARAIVTRGLRTFDRLAAVPYATLALIRGFCLGGGLELALACRYRVVVDEPSTRLGLPEVMLGILPGWGGVARLPRLIGGPAALDMMLTGKTVDARKAKKLGLADECVPPRIMDNTARGVLRALPPPRKLPFPLSLTQVPVVRRFIAAQARKQVARRARPEHYPAPYAILDLWSKYDGDPFAPPAGDPASVLTLVKSPTTANLLRVFKLQERLKSLGKDEDGSAAGPPLGARPPQGGAARSDATGESIAAGLPQGARPPQGEAARTDASGGTIKRVHVVGAGTMGGDIAAWCALRGMTVTLQDQSAERLAPAMQRAAKLFGERLRDPRRARDAADRLIPDVQGHGIARADVIIEAIFENVDAKRALFADVERRARADAILATNTSSIPLEDIATAMRDPSRLVGLHFFNPVARMMLVEIVVGRSTDAALIPRCAAFVRAIDKLPLPVKSAPGFLVNRVLAPYLMTAMRCVDEGIPPETVDEAALAFGMPMGPIELADSVGLDICLAVGRMLKDDAVPPQRLTTLVNAGHLGKKSGRGFYAWLGGKPQKQRAGAVPAGLAQRLVDPLVAEARAALAEGIVADADLVDAGAIFGTGFAPFRGGPLHDADAAAAARA